MTENPANPIPADPISDFETAAAGDGTAREQPVEVGFDGDRAFESEEERAAFEERARERIDEANEETARRMREGQDADQAAAAAGGDQDLDTFRQSWWERNRDANVLKLVDKGDYLRFRPDQKLMEEQIRAALLRAIFEKGYKQIYFYRGGQIDHGMTAQAQTMLAKLERQGMVPPNTFQVIGQRMDGPEPWLGAIGRWRRDVRNEQHDAKGARAERRQFGEASGVGDRFMRGIDGKRTAEDEISKRFGHSAVGWGRKARPEPGEARATGARDSGASPHNPAGAGGAAADDATMAAGAADAAATAHRDTPPRDPPPAAAPGPGPGV